MFAASGDHAVFWVKTPAPPVVRCCGLAPSTFMTQISYEPSRSLENAILVPSEDQSGSWSCEVSLFTRARPLPFAFMVQML